MKQIDNLQPSLLPAEFDLISYEKNLAGLSLFSASDPRSGQKVRRFEKEVTRDGHRTRHNVTIIGSEEYGLPTISDQDKFLALAKIIQSDFRHRESIQNPIRFTGYRICKELGIAPTSKAYEAIHTWGRRMASVTITSDVIVFMGERKVYDDSAVHVFDRFSRSGVSTVKGQKTEGYEVVLAEWIVENLKKSFVVVEDFTAYKSLTRPLAKGIYEVLHVLFGGSGLKPAKKDYSELCDQLGVPAYKHKSKIKETLGASLDELKKIGFLSDWSLSKMSTKPGFMVNLSAGPELVNVFKKNKLGKRLLGDEDPFSTDKPLSSEQLEAVQALEKFDVDSYTATILTKTYGAERVIDVVDYHEPELTKARSKIRKPGAFLRWFLENQMELPITFVSRRRQLQAEAEKRAAEDERSRNQEIEFAYRVWIDQVVDKAMKERYDAAELEAKIRKVIADNKDEEAFKAVPASFRADVARQVIRKEIKDGMNFPTLAQWTEERSQGKLFEAAD